MNCEKCNKEIDGTYGSGRFCSRSCANSKIRTKEIKEKISNSLKGRDVGFCKGSKHSEISKQKMKNKIMTKEQIEKLINIKRKQSKNKKFKIKDLRKNKKQCKKCGSIKNLEVHHCDGNKNNNNDKNLILLCKSCHRKEHYLIGTKNGKLGQKNVPILCPLTSRPRG